MSDYTRDWLIRTIAKRAGFTIGDVRIVFNTFEDVIKDVIEEQGELVIPGLFKLYTKEVKPHDGWDAVRNIPLKVKESHRIVFKPSRRLLALIKKE